MARESHSAREISREIGDSDDVRDDAIAGARDFMHGFVDRVGAALGVDTNTRDDDDNGGAPYTSNDERELSRASTIALRAPSPLALPPASAASAAPVPPVKRAWQIVELKSGACVVTNGMQTAACPSRAYAESLLAELGRQGGAL